MSRRKLPELEVAVEEITPEIAEEWLKKNTFNRKRSDRLVDLYAEAMMSDEWRLNGEPIIFDKLGKLQSGQHRLWACIESGCTFWSLVVRGTDPDAIYTVDTGRKRSLPDALQLRMEKDVASLSSVLSWTWRWEHGLMDSGNKTRPTNVALLRLLDSRPEIRESLHVGGRFLRKVPVPRALMSALFYQFSLIDKVDAEVFLEQCTAGENLGTDDAAYAWRRWMFSHMQEASRPNQQTVAAITVKAWNAFRTHTPVKSFRWAGNEPFPEAK